MEAMDIVKRAREPSRPKGSDFIEGICDYFYELHGDRMGYDDKSVITGLAMIKDMPVTVIVQQKGRTLKENKKRNYGMLKPEGYRKIKRIVLQAEKFKRPILTFIDTPGASCGKEAEEGNQANAIAECIATFSNIKVPTLSIVIGEGGSGGALAIGVTDEIWVLENSVYSVLSPEGFASILWKDSKRSAEAANLMHLTSRELKEDKIIDNIVSETEDMMPKLKEEIYNFFQANKKKDIVNLLQERYHRYRIL